MMSGKRWGYVVQFFCLLVFLGMSPFLIKMDGGKTRSVSSDSVRSQNVSDEVKPVVALTFDDGPNASSTPILLDGLKERKVRATFFLIGENVEKDENEKITIVSNDRDYVQLISNDIRIYLIFFISLS